MRPKEIVVVQDESAPFQAEALRQLEMQVGALNKKVESLDTAALLDAFDKRARQIAKAECAATQKAALQAVAQVIKEERATFEARIEASLDRVAGSVQRAQAAAEGPVKSAALRIRGRLREIEGGSHD